MMDAGKFVYQLLLLRKENRQQRIKRTMQLNQSDPSPDTDSDEQSFMHRLMIALAKSETQIAMITGASAGFVGGITTQRRVLQSILGAVVPLVAFAYLGGE
jgi:hypothetical protein